MKKIVVATDSFKGTLSSKMAGEIISRAIRDEIPRCSVRRVGIADGGEGTVDALGAKKVNVVVTGPNFRPVPSFYGVLGDRAVIELAAAAGLTLADPADPLVTTTYGVGELIVRSLNSGFRKITVAVGGSATNDLGCGMAAACGAVFYDIDGKPFIPVGATLGDIASFDLSGLDKRLSLSEITVMCDVTNPLFGESGAAYVFAPQKGADADGVLALDRGLRHAAGLIEKTLGIPVSDIPGSGAAGGCGAGLLAFFGAGLNSGIDAVLDAVRFDELVEDADLVITGEGRFDSQSSGGKTVSGVTERASRARIPVAVICGSADPSASLPGVVSVFPVVGGEISKETSLAEPEKYLYLTARRAIKSLSEK